MLRLTTLLSLAPLPARALTSTAAISSAFATLSAKETRGEMAATAKHVGELNVLGEQLQVCGLDPLTGFYRDGFCVTGPDDHGRHVVAARVTQEFLTFTASRGNDLQSPRLPWFVGLKPGNSWCLCALRWKEAYEAGAAPPVDLAATSDAALRYVPLEALAKHALTPEQAQRAKQLLQAKEGTAAGAAEAAGGAAAATAASAPTAGQS